MLKLNCIDLTKQFRVKNFKKVFIYIFSANKGEVERGD
jgi:hypothetical protein